MPSGHTNSCLQLFNLRSAAELLPKERKKKKKNVSKKMFWASQRLHFLSLSSLESTTYPSLPPFPTSHSTLPFMTCVVLSVTMFHDMTLPYCKSVLSWSGLSCDYGVSRVAKQVHQVHEASTYGPRTQSGDLPPLPSMRGCDWQKPVSHPLHVGYIFTPQFHVYGSIQISRVMQEGRNESGAVFRQVLRAGADSLSLSLLLSSKIRKVPASCFFG